MIETRRQNRDSPAPGRPPGGARPIGLVIVASLALALVIGGSPAGAAANGGGHKTLKYAVTNLDYNGTGDLTASRQTAGCVAGDTAQWGGLASSVVDYGIGDDLHPLVVGKAALDLQGGADGSIDIDDAPTRNRFVATHRVSTACYLGFPVAEVDTRCGPAVGTPEPGHVFEAHPDFDSSLYVHADIVAHGKRKVSILWEFRQRSAQGEPGFVERRSACAGQPFRFPGWNCTSTASLKQLRVKRKKSLTLKFGDCRTVVRSAPNTDSYLAIGHARGRVRLKRRG